MPFEIVRNDITVMQADAIVNTANPEPVIGSGTDRGIHRKAGEKLLEARKKIGSIRPGDAAITPGFDLPAKYVIHAVGPVWKGGVCGEQEILTDCYRKALFLALENHCTSIAFPLLSTGNYGFPRDLSMKIALRECSTFLMEHEMQIYLVVFESEAFTLSEKLFRSISSYIDETYVQEKTREEYDANYASEDPSEKAGAFSADGNAMVSEEATAGYKEEKQFSFKQTSPEQTLRSLLQNLDAGFSETLLRLIDRTAKKDSEIYKKANVDRKLFSKIRNNPDYRPSKTTALAFAFALELSLEETVDFIARAGYALSHSSRFDVIIEYFLIHGNYDIFQLNEMLFEFDQPLLGA